MQDNNDAWSREVRTSITISAKAGKPANPPTINSFKCNPVSIIAGVSSTLTWNVSDASSVTIEPGIGIVSLIGSATVSPTSTTIYMLTATNSQGSDIAKVRLIVSTPGAPPEPPQQDVPPVIPQPQAKPVINSFVANQANIVAGQSTTLVWNVSGADSVLPSWKNGTIPQIGHETVSPPNTHFYTITAINQAGSTVATLEVTVAPPQPVAPPKITKDIPLVYSECGTVANNGAVIKGEGAAMMTGDTFENITLQAFLSFDISNIPGGAKITDVLVDFSDYHMVSGKPFTTLGCLRGYAHSYDSPDAGDFYVAQPLGAIIRYCTVAEIMPEHDEDVLNALQEKVGGKRFQIRLQFNTNTDANGDSDFIMWTPNVHYPKMTVTYTPPPL